MDDLFARGVGVFAGGGNAIGAGGNMISSPFAALLASVFRVNLSTPSQSGVLGIGDTQGILAAKIPTVFGSKRTPPMADNIVMSGHEALFTNASQGIQIASVDHHSGPIATPDYGGGGFEIT